MSRFAVPRTVVYHLGARHHYAVPSAFASVGALEAFYTDMCASVGLGKLSRTLRGLPYPQKLARLASALSDRVLPAEIEKATSTCDLATLNYYRALFAASDTRETAIALYKFVGHMSDLMRQKGLRGARQVYASMGEGNSLVRHAKEEGARIAIDVVIAPSWHTRVIKEHEAYPDWGPEPVNWVAPTREHPSLDEESLGLADLYVCPSEFVRSDIVERYGVDPHKTALVPYAVSDEFLSITNRPQLGHVLFGGTATLRKGIHYFARAANLLAAEGRIGYRFSVAGNVEAEVVARPECSNLSFLGRVPRPQMRVLLGETDVFALPSIAEGSAGVIYEALAAGVPVVTTPSAGSVVRDGVDGFVVPTGDGAALADAIRTIVTNRPLRDRMSLAARERAGHYSWNRYASRLMQAVA